MRIKQTPLKTVKIQKSAPAKGVLNPKRKSGQADLLRSIEAGGSIKVHAERISAPNNLHTIANRLGMKVAVRKINDGKHAGKLQVFRLK